MSGPPTPRSYTVFRSPAFLSQKFVLLLNGRVLNARLSLTLVDLVDVNRRLLLLLVG